ncbi:MAG: VWA domain-containing protein [Chitinophagales bacterium]
MIDFLKDIRFEDPWLFLLLLMVPVYIIYDKRGSRKKLVEFKISSLNGTTAKTKRAPKVKWISILLILRIIAFVFIVIALARPQTGFSNKKISSQGIDIVLSLDVSASMYAIDFKPNRMEAAKIAAKEFIDGRPGDRIGLVVFAGETFTQSPPTLDHELLKQQVDHADDYYLLDGTAIGDGLFMAVNRLADTSNLSTKVIILLTDGVRMGGKFSPIDAANAAKQLNIRVYTIGVGSDTGMPIPVVDKNGRRVFELDPRISFDESTLKEVADITDGTYFKATSKEKLVEVYKEIDQIEKQKVEVDITQRYEEQFYYFAFAGIILLMLEIIFRNTIFRSLT